MIAVVTGGSASGKSAFAERLACALPGPHAYVATMRHGDAETEARIARHVRMRDGKGFTTVELADSDWEGTKCSPNPAGGGFPDEGAQPPHQGEGRKSLPDPDSRGCKLLSGYRTALLEDLGNLVANGLQGRLDEVLACENVVIVANEVGGDGALYDPFTMDYIKKIGALACELGARADVVVEVVAGVPFVAKGEVPWEC